MEGANGLVYRFGEFTLDRGRRELARGGVPVPLGRLTFELLLALVRAAPNVLTHDELVAQVWRGRSTSPETVTQRVKLLRDALGDSAAEPRYVGLVRNHGYRWIAPLERVDGVAGDLPAGGARPEGRSYLPAERGGDVAVGAVRRPRRRIWALAAAAAAVVALVAAGAALGPRLHSPSPPEPVAIAVLPLANFSSDPEQEYFADGMTEALIANLARIGGLAVISRTSTAAYKGTRKTIPEIGRELGVAAVLEGSTQLEGDRVRITAQLIDAASDRHLWAETYDVDFADVLRVQSELATRIAAEIEVTVTPGEAARLAAAARPVDRETYRAYLRGMYHLAKGTPEDLARGIRFLHDAVDADPGDPLAYVGLAFGYTTLGHGPEPPPDAWARAAAAANRAIALDPDLPEAHAALADIKLYVEWDWEGAERAFLRANELAPSLAMNRFHHAWYLGLFGRWEEAVAEHKHAKRLDPLNPLHTFWLGGLYLYNDLGRYAEALEQARLALEIQPDNPTALLVLGRALSAAGRHEEALATHRRMIDLNPAMTWELGLTYAMAGRLDETRAILERIERDAPTPWTAFGRAMLHARLGETEKALEWLRYEPPHAWVPWVRVDPWMRPSLESGPGFTALLAEMGLPP